jgi:hypothetical protein
VRLKKISIKAAPGKPLTILLKSPLYMCTLPKPGNGGCEQTFSEGATGRFTIEKREAG